MKTKLIGVTVRVTGVGDDRKQFINERYLTPIHKMGFNSILLSLDNPNFEEVLSLCDGFIVAGGNDIDPSIYHQTNIGKSKGCDSHLDKLDQEVILYAVKHSIPLLGICRGHQSINVFLGGTLIQDIGEGHQKTKHDVTSYRNRYFDFPKKFTTNSYHHQILDKIADNFEIIAKSEDGVIEGVIHKSLPIISVQWHPEKETNDPINQKIFNKFFELVLENKKR